jgi:hypothetical protein
MSEEKYSAMKTPGETEPAVVEEVVTESTGSDHTSTEANNVEMRLGEQEMEELVD